MVSFIHSASTTSIFLLGLSLLTNLANGFSVLAPSRFQHLPTTTTVISRLDTYIPITHTSKANNLLLHLSSEDEIFEAEEEAAFDAHDLSDAGFEAAAMERAVMFAYDMMKTKRDELKDLVQATKSAEEQFVMMSKATDELEREHKANLSKFIRNHSTDGSSQLAIQMLQGAIARAAEEILDTEIRHDKVLASFYDTLDEERFYKEEATKVYKEAKASEERLDSIEEFDGDYELEERRRDMSVHHSARDLVQDIRHKFSNAKGREKDAILMEKELQGKLDQLHKEKKVLEDDMKELKKIVQEQLSKEWKEEEENIRYKV